ncbi:MAG: hypothetical protein F4087_00005, partial [Gemmatimonadetes bacterium]|nr:hypothetical protein [Gemmatimonadota bacterium]
MRGVVTGMVGGPLLSVLGRLGVARGPWWRSGLAVVPLWPPARQRTVFAVAVALVGCASGAARVAGQTPLSFDRYRATVEPIFLVDRGGWGPGRAACVTCHAEQGTPLRLQRLRETAEGEVFWSEEDSRRNFRVVARLVTPGDPDGSRLLRKALARSAGGAALHVGGKFFQSQEDPEWRAMADWVAAADPVERALPPSLDFDFFRECVQRVFLDKRPGDVECVHCHESGSRGFARPIPEGRDFWNEEESERNFAAARRFVEPGQPMMSRLLTHPLAPAGGGDYFHGGPRRWATTDDPVWLMVAAGVRGETPECVVGRG